MSVNIEARKAMDIITTQFPNDIAFMDYYVVDDYIRIITNKPSCMFIGVMMDTIRKDGIDNVIAELGRLIGRQSHG